MEPVCQTYFAVVTYIMQKTKKQLIEKYAQRFPNGSAEYGSFAKIARQVGCTKQYVTTVLRDRIKVKLWSEKRRCPTCRQIFTVTSRTRNKKHCTHACATRLYFDKISNCPICKTKFIWSAKSQHSFKHNLVQGLIRFPAQYKPCCNRSHATLYALKRRNKARNLKV